MASAVKLISEIIVPANVFTVGYIGLTLVGRGGQFLQYSSEA